MRSVGEKEKSKIPKKAMIGKVKNKKNENKLSEWKCKGAVPVTVNEIEQICISNCIHPAQLPN